MALTYQCTDCQEENFIDSEFCNGCGKRLFTDCTKCGWINKQDSSFCSKCGGPTEYEKCLREVEAEKIRVEAEKYKKRRAAAALKVRNDPAWRTAAKVRAQIGIEVMEERKKKGIE
jgi:hypothetical protein